MMDDRRFDNLSRAVSGETGSRRSLAKLLAGGVLAPVAGRLGVPSAVAENRKCPVSRTCGKKCCAKAQTCQAKTCLDRCASDADCGVARRCCDGGCCGVNSQGCDSAGRCRIGGLFGRNLLANPGAEAGRASPDGLQPVGVPGWQKSTEFTVVSYRLGNGFPTAADPGPDRRGSKFFSGGEINLSVATQTIDLAAEATAIDTGTVTYGLGGHFGGFASQDDSAKLEAQFFNANRVFVRGVTLGPFLAADRGNQTGLFPHSLNGFVPVSARLIRVVLTMNRTEGLSNDGYADNLSFSLG